MSQYTEDSVFSATGRFSRSAFLAWSSLLFFAVIFLFFMIYFISPHLFLDVISGSFGIGMILFVIIYIVFNYFNFVFIIRRLHDRNHIGWFSLLMFVPIVNAIFSLYLIFAPGNDHRNNYGKPRPTAGWEKIFCWITVIVWLVIGFAYGVLLTMMSNH